MLKLKKIKMIDFTELGVRKLFFLSVGKFCSENRT